MFADVEKSFRELAPPGQFCSLRVVRQRHERLSVRRDVVQPVSLKDDTGAMVTVFDGGGGGYAATADLSRDGLRRALREARHWAHASAGRTLVDFNHGVPPASMGEFRTSPQQPWSEVPLAAKLDELRRQCARLKIDDRIIDWEAGLWFSHTEALYLTADGGRSAQEFQAVLPSLQVTAHRQGETQCRSFGNDAHFRQGGLELLETVGFEEAAPRVAEQALELLAAPNCPSGALELVLAPDQMVLQIHESIGHPLELDRILGDERNYAGTSFVTPDMFGHYRYGSELLNVTFDPGHPQQIASYGYDDDGHPARREYIIRDGVLERPLGGALSQARAGLAGVANARASGWNRPPIDRMANLNLEPGASSFGDLISAVERGVYMETNRSWSIDDSRNKFQFGCEWGRLIENGELAAVVKNSNYRGVSANFWRSLDAVGEPPHGRSWGFPTVAKGSRIK